MRIPRDLLHVVLPARASEIFQPASKRSYANCFVYVPFFVRHILSDASLDLKIEELLANRARKNKTRQNDWALNKFNSWLIASIFGYQFTSFEQIPVDSLNNLSQNGGNHFDPLSNSRKKL